MSLEFKEEMLLPNINGEVYYSIYELENWLRRICLTVYLMEYGSNWMEFIASPIRRQYENRIRRSNELVYLDADSDNHLIWAATYGEITNLVLTDSVWAHVQDLTGFNRDRFAQKLNELREVRNMLAHNRALSDTTATIVRGIVASLRLAINNFKGRILYSSMPIIDHYDDEELSRYFTLKMAGNDWGRFQAFLAGDDKLFSLTCLPVERGGNDYPSALRLFEKYNDVKEFILAFLLNKTGGEYSVLFARKTPLEQCKKIVDIFISEKNVFTYKRFIEQHPKYICNPKIWFYENRRPIDE